MDDNLFGLQRARQLLAVGDDADAEGLAVAVEYVRYVGGRYHFPVCFRLLLPSGYLVRAKWLHCLCQSINLAKAGFFIHNSPFNRFFANKAAPLKTSNPLDSTLDA